MGRMRDRCRCCFSAETLETLKSPLFDMFKIICLPQDGQNNESSVKTCFKCQNFLKEVYRFRRKFQAIDEILSNNFKDVKHKVDLMLKGMEDDIPLNLLVKTEITIENNEIEMDIDKFEANSESKPNLKQIPFVSINEVDISYLPEHTQPVKDQLSIKPAICKTERKREPKSFKRNPKEKRFACEECSFKTTRMYKLREHERTHTGERPFSCQLCTYSSSTKSNLNIHMKNKHSDERPYPCDLCDHRAKSKNSLIIHKKVHLNARDFACELCPYRSLTSSGLENHIKSAHTGEKPFVCDRCPFRTTNMANLRCHIKLHDDYRKFACKECSFTCNKLSQLNAHMTKHTGEKPFRCDLCNGKFTKLASLRRHVRKIHAKLFDQHNKA